jgi:hypothetical protein
LEGDNLTKEVWMGEEEVVVTKAGPGDKISVLGRHHAIEIECDKNGVARAIHKCCDCLLKHEIIIKPVDGAVQISMIREGT